MPPRLNTNAKPAINMQQQQAVSIRVTSECTYPYVIDERAIEIGDFVRMTQPGEYLPLWHIRPTVANALSNRLVDVLMADDVCCVLDAYDDGTCLVLASHGVVYAVSCCLEKAQLSFVPPEE